MRSDVKEIATKRECEGKNRLSFFSLDRSLTERVTLAVARRHRFAAGNLCSLVPATKNYETLLRNYSSVSPRKYGRNDAPRACLFLD